MNKFQKYCRANGIFLKKKPKITLKSNEYKLFSVPDIEKPVLHLFYAKCIEDIIDYGKSFKHFPASTMCFEKTMIVDKNLVWNSYKYDDIQKMFYGEPGSSAHTWTKQIYQGLPGKKFSYITNDFS